MDMPNGSIDGIRIYNRALSENEVRARATLHNSSASESAGWTKIKEWGREPEQ